MTSLSDTARRIKSDKDQCSSKCSLERPGRLAKTLDVKGAETLMHVFTLELHVRKPLPAQETLSVDMALGTHTPLQQSVVLTNHSHMWCHLPQF